MILIRWRSQSEVSMFSKITKFTVNQLSLAIACFVVLVLLLSVMACTDAPQNTVSITSTNSPTITNTPVVTLTNMPTPVYLPTNTVMPTNTPTPEPTETPLPTETSTPEPTATATPSSMIAFAFWDEEINTYQLGVMNADGSNRLEFAAPTLTGPDDQPPALFRAGAQFSWSPDGSLIASIFWDPEDEIFRLGIMNPDGSEWVELDLAVAGHPASSSILSYTWSPDGLRIAFASGIESLRRMAKELYIANVDGTELTQVEGITELLDGFHGVYSPVWSPSGEQILFGLGSDLYIINLNGSNITKIATDPNLAFVLFPTWSPDGQWIVANSQGGGVFLIHNEPPYETQQITSLISGEWHWSSDASFLLGNVLALSDDALTEPLIFNMSNMDLVQIPELSTGDYLWEFSPDGTKIVFQSERDGNSEIYVANMDGSNLIQLTHNDFAEKSISWSPDGTKILFVLDQNGSHDIYVVNIDGSEETQLTDTSVEEFEANWQPLP